jgi:hypothetical protein
VKKKIPQRILNMTLSRFSASSPGSHSLYPLAGLQDPERLEDGNGRAEHTADQARLSVLLPKGLYKQIKLKAHDQDMTLSAWLIKLIRSELG